MKIRKNEILKKKIAHKIWKNYGNFIDTDGWDCKSFLVVDPVSFKSMADVS